MAFHAVSQFTLPEKLGSVMKQSMEQLCALFWRQEGLGGGDGLQNAVRSGAGVSALLQQLQERADSYN